MEDKLLLIGKIVSTHGIQGKLRVYSYAESCRTFSTLDFLYVKDRKGDIKKYKLVHIEPHKNVLLLELEGISFVDDAEKLVGSSVLMEKSSLDSLPEDEYYWFEIIGLEVFTDDGTFLGKVEKIIQTGSNDVYVIRDMDREFLIPAIEDIVVRIDVLKKTMIVHPIEGLL
ncbi:MAG: ribosome maturation factor RimM [Thermodesulfobacteriota bacterium]|nr:ribosome maturation factor RimM [Thermodesulfobacteriota bacterium]